MNFREIKQHHIPAIISIVALFIVDSLAFYFAYLVSESTGSEFVGIKLPFAFTISSIVIIGSSITFHFGLVSVKKGNLAIAKVSIVATLILGLLFVLSQFMGWVALNESGIIAAGKESTQESSFLYLLTGLHVVHLVGGLVSLVIVLFKTMKERYSVDNLLGMQVSITYWHFLGVLWIYLYCFFRYYKA